MDKKINQLGMNPSTASARLLKDLLFEFVVAAGHVCFRCKQPLTRETFSIEHTVPWLDSINPLELFFDLKNITYSHLLCNIAAARKIKQSNHGTASMYRDGCKCLLCLKYTSLRKKRSYTPEARRKKYLNKGY